MSGIVAFPQKVTKNNRFIYIDDYDQDDTSLSNRGLSTMNIFSSNRDSGAVDTTHLAIQQRFSKDGLWKNKPGEMTFVTE